MLYGVIQESRTRSLGGVHYVPILVAMTHPGKFKFIALLTVPLCTFALRAGAAAPQVQEISCELCHSDETQQWRDSAHARAMQAQFTREWERTGKKWECLTCHTSHYNRKRGTYSHAGVDCESCHGAAKSDHPGEGKMGLPVDSKVCQKCHKQAFNQWRLSAHGQKNVRCFDCHKMHKMALRKTDPDGLCGSCHPGRLKDFSHATHRVKGLHCVSCHMPTVEGGAAARIRGTGTPGHSLGVGVETCNKCHRDMVHESHEVASLQKEIGKIKSGKLQNEIEELGGEVEKLKGAVKAGWRNTIIAGVLSLVVGAFLGFIYRRRQSGDPR